jgi:hypothetical protein
MRGVRVPRFPLNVTITATFSANSLYHQTIALIAQYAQNRRLYLLRLTILRVCCPLIIKMLLKRAAKFLTRRSTNARKHWVNDLKDEQKADKMWSSLDLIAQGV